MASVTSAFHVYNITTGLFMEIKIENVSRYTWIMYDNNSQSTQPIAVSGHTATVANNKMYIIFGYNPIRAYINTVQIFDFGKTLTTNIQHPIIAVSNTWSIQYDGVDSTIPSSPQILPALYAHTSVFDHWRNRILVYGGHEARVREAGALSSVFLSYDLETYQWYVWIVRERINTT
jgi:hypothetical protein